MSEIHVHLACNDEHGRFAGNASAFEFQTEDTEAMVTCGLGQKIAVEYATGAIVVAGVRYPITDRKGHVGNLLWDAVTMSLGDARRLLAQLLKAGFRPDEWACEGPLSDLMNEAAKGFSEVRLGG